jgi:pimeloyl-ACP methyl ester carboxylesterase
VTDGAVRPFTLAVPEIVLEDLRTRLARTRFPDAAPVAGWDQGLPLDYARELRDHWLHRYDWRATETRLNELGQQHTVIDGVDVHLLHVRSPEPAAVPLLLSHGWPGSVVEFLDVIGPLTDPVAHGGDAADAFHVVAPSLPGYGFSSAPTVPGWDVERIADAWVVLMNRLGHGRFIAQGGDWGAMVSTAIAVRHPASLHGVHVNMPLVRPTDDPYTDEERALEARYRRFLDTAAYGRVQTTSPQTLGYGLADSPMGQAAWIIEKFAQWTDNDGHPEDAVSRDRLLDDVMLYWLSNAGTSSARLYWESWLRPDLSPVEVPAGLSLFPADIMGSSRRWAEARFLDLRTFHVHDRGGHFAALEVPDLLVEDLRAFARTVRATAPAADPAR